MCTESSSVIVVVVVIVSLSFSLSLSPGAFHAHVCLRGCKRVILLLLSLLRRGLLLIRLLVELGAAVALFVLLLHTLRSRCAELQRSLGLLLHVCSRAWPDGEQGEGGAAAADEGWRGERRRGAGGGTTVVVACLSGRRGLGEC